MSLFNEINNELNNQVKHSKLMLEAAKGLDIENGMLDPNEVQQAWQAASDRDVVSEYNGVSAASARNAESDWVANMDNKQKLDISAKVAQPASGNIVMLGDTLGKIVDVDIDTNTKKVTAIAIQGADGKEKVFPMAQIAGPKMVNGKPTWMLRK